MTYPNHHGALEADVDIHVGALVDMGVDHTGTEIGQRIIGWNQHELLRANEQKGSRADCEPFAACRGQS